MLLLLLLHLVYYSPFLLLLSAIIVLSQALAANWLRATRLGPRRQTLPERHEPVDRNTRKISYLGCAEGQIFIRHTFEWLSTSPKFAVQSLDAEANEGLPRRRASTCPRLFRSPKESCTARQDFCACANTNEGASYGIILAMIRSR